MPLLFLVVSLADKNGTLHQGGNRRLYRCPGAYYDVAISGPRRRSLLVVHVGSRSVFSVSRSQPRQVDFKDPGQPRSACLSDLFASGFGHHDGLEVVKFYVCSGRS